MIFSVRHTKKEGKKNANSITNKTQQKSGIILCDSMIKHVNGLEISKKLNSKCRVFV